mmetsp:Transcript_44931/g.106680  ORF Transcript_44931/g.106680 Transcript_44931/m.106680 type:complete len:570 (+) Transcript_44931:75-1784(+)|eukprot:CAMPEP_0178382498 /NCGR_PEP_ID=MMETSP0689_2-20121128/6524_1 /TAXON_ID=160604 /ORGANISM="Amphidinium massartii, Strain CS-259" /LENGTH=569 /DNA_ID=CAMNT_0020002703 /DNA_START=70 /DNA_END=1779 /DNA_ORIENTATION=-
MSAVLQQIASLNRSKVLKKPLRYSEVKDALTGIGNEAALQLLQEMESQAAYIDDPVQHILQSAEEYAAGGMPAYAADVAPEPMNRKRGRGEEIAPSLKRVKLESPHQRQAGLHAQWQSAVKSEGPVPWSKTEQLSDAEKIARRIDWINQHSNLSRPLQSDDVAEVFDCIGLRQSMRLLRRLQESADTVDDPAEFIFTLAARAGWIWSKPDIIDEDVKVAKRVAWMNLFSGLANPIDYAQVADVLDGLKVPHAMVLLRELELQREKIDDPTEYIKRMVSDVGEDEVEVPLEDAEAVPPERPWRAAQVASKSEPPQVPAKMPMAPRTPPMEDESPTGDANAAAAGTEWYDGADAEGELQELEDTSALAMQYADEDVEQAAGGRPFAHSEPSALPRRTTYLVREAREAAVEANTIKRDAGPSELPISPQEKQLEMQKLAQQAGLHIDDEAAKKLGRLTFRQAQDLFAEIKLGGRDRTQVRNPSRYIQIAVDKMSLRLGAEQGLAMELAAQHGVALNNEALDELASIPRKFSHEIIRSLTHSEARLNPLSFIRDEVSKVRAQLDARPFGQGST